MINIDVNLSELALVFAIFLRLSVLIFLLPVFSNANVPMPAKALACAALTALLYPVLRPTLEPVSLEPMALTLAALGELMFAVVFGLSMLLVIGAFQVAGELISFEMGFGFAQAADPLGGTHVAIFSVWFQVMAMMLFFTINGHHMIIRAIVESFRTIPIGAFALDAALYQKVIALAGRLFVVAIKVAAPVMIALLLTHMGMGLMAKFAPQINILTTSFPVTIFLGILFMSFSVIIWGNSMQLFFRELIQFIQGMIAAR